MAKIEELEQRIDDAESTLQAMFCTITADLIMFQAAVSALREEGVLTARMIDRMAIDAQIRLQQYDSPALGAPAISEIAAQLDGLAEQLRAGVPSAPAPAPTRPVHAGNGRAPRPAARSPVR
ncbi:hypothetical protein FRZ44_20790 [Hypericibacter terrae]|jgi:hypothetical protein|uniref:Uncharacterized protein n=1 Tax=Hypericibacter terrae TaxID=2602015 RepID=A0A5J6MH76_9PROT|nr:hypothetical protein [Hypericibacter terrae]QEX16784.1 hypothetical protein FRZ44_20790 [Hypericibacter terrae]